MDTSINITAAKIQTRRDKKSRSNAEIKPLALKKSGVYVEKKPTKILSEEPSDIAPNRLKCAPRPGKKQFLNSVLNILSTNTVRIQCADSNDPITTTNSGNNSKKMKPQYDGGSISPKRKHKYKTKTYDIYDFQSEIDDPIAQDSININRSPSNYTESTQNEPEDIKWSEFLPRLVPQTDSDIEDEKKFKMAQQTASNNGPKKDNHLYNFFVDLLQNTFNDHQGKSSDSTQATRANSSQDDLEIDMAVDNNVYIENSEYTRNDSANTGQRKKFCTITPRNTMDEIILDDMNYEILPNRKRKLKATSFVNNKNISEQLRARSYIYQKPSEYSRKTLNNSRKQSLLNSLKKQLRMNIDQISQPQNIYQALKLMAENKRRAKSIRFEEPVKKIKEGDVFKSVFGRHQLLSPPPKTKYKKISMPLRSKFNRSYPQNSMINTRKALVPMVKDNRISRHSLRVYAYDIASQKKINDVTEPTSKVLHRDLSSNDISLYLSDDSFDFEDSVMGNDSQTYPF